MQHVWAATDGLLHGTNGVGFVNRVAFGQIAFLTAEVVQRLEDKIGYIRPRLHAVAESAFERVLVEHSGAEAVDGGDWRVVEGLLRGFQAFQNIFNIVFCNRFRATCCIKKRKNLFITFRKRTIRCELQTGVQCFGEDSAQTVTEFGSGQFRKCDDQNFRNWNALQKQSHKENLDVVRFASAGPRFDEMIAAERTFIRFKFHVAPLPLV